MARVVGERRGEGKKMIQVHLKQMGFEEVCEEGAKEGKRWEKDKKEKGKTRKKIKHCQLSGCIC